MWKLLAVSAACAIILALADDTKIPEYIRSCQNDDPQLIECLKKSLEHVRPYLSKGIPEIEMPSIEPFIMDSLVLQLTDGPQGYRVSMKNIEVFGASNFQVKSIKLSENGKPFEARIIMPKLTIETKYTSSGVLLIIPASGGGELHGVFEGVVADLKGKVSTSKRSEGTNGEAGGTYLHVDSLHLDLNMKRAQLSISNVFNNNRILTEATNLFLRENAIEVVRAMQPQLQKKLATEFSKIANQLLKYVPVQQFLIGYQD